MKRISDKRKAQLEYTTPAREAFKLEHHVCWICFSGTSDVHEIVRGQNRIKALSMPETWLSLCRNCHLNVHQLSMWTMVRQYALKGLMDAKNYDRVLLNRTRGKAVDSITEREVWEALPEVINNQNWR